jgi:hypothetical protein
MHLAKLLCVYFPTGGKGVAGKPKEDQKKVRKPNAFFLDLESLLDTDKLDKYKNKKEVKKLLALKKKRVEGSPKKKEKKLFWKAVPRSINTPPPPEIVLQPIPPPIPPPETSSQPIPPPPPPDCVPSISTLLPQPGVPLDGAISIYRDKNPFTGASCIVIRQSFPNCGDAHVFVNDKSLGSFFHFIVSMLI